MQACKLALGAFSALLFGLRWLAAAGAAAEAEAKAEVAVAEPVAAAESSDVRIYVLNTNTHKFHYPDRSSVRDMVEHNKRIVESTREQVIDKGYVPCKRCNL